MLDLYVAMLVTHQGQSSVAPGYPQIPGVSTRPAKVPSVEYPKHFLVIARLLANSQAGRTGQQNVRWGGPVVSSVSREKCARYFTPSFPLSCGTYATNVRIAVQSCCQIWREGRLAQGNYSNIQKCSGLAIYPEHLLISIRKLVKSCCKQNVITNSITNGNGSRASNWLK